MQNSSQTKDLIKDHFSFTAFFLQPLQCIVSSMVLQSPCCCLEFTGCSNIYREYRRRALNTVFQPAPSMIHRMEFFMSWNWPLKQNLYCLLFTIFHTETFWSAAFASLKFLCKGFLLIVIRALLVLWNKASGLFFPVSKSRLSYSRCSSLTPSSHGKSCCSDPAVAHPGPQSSYCPLWNV